MAAPKNAVQRIILIHSINLPIQGFIATDCVIGKFDEA